MPDSSGVGFSVLKVSRLQPARVEATRLTSHG
jgi:hypothetical protein